MNIDKLLEENNKLRGFLVKDGFLKLLRDRDDLRQVNHVLIKGLEELVNDTTSPVVKLHKKILKLSEKVNELTR